ncbi:MAG: hypothetical protein ACAI35_03220 [Candidatus Methylacidiphilales bacterium]
MSTDATAEKNDPLTAVGDTMSSAASAIKTGASDAKDAVARAIPATTQAVSKAVYSTFYYVSYGVVYTSLFVKNYIPLENPIGYGITDGAAAAAEATSDRLKDSSD